MKKFLACLLVLASVFAAHGEWVMWAVDFTEANPLPWSDEDDVTTAWLSIYTDSSKKTKADTEISSVTDLGTSYASREYDFSEDSRLFKTHLDSTVVEKLDGGAWSSYLFYIELGNSSGEVAWTSKGLTYDALEKLGALKSDGVDPIGDASISRWWVGESTPEPTSGMLLLIGASLLALRRRGRQV